MDEECIKEDREMLPRQEQNCSHQATYLCRREDCHPFLLQNRG